jgi:hypothetical protein
MALVDFVEAFGELLITSFISKLAAVIKNGLRKRVPDFVAHRLTRKLARGFFKVASEFIVTLVASRESHDDYTGWQLAVGRQVIQRRHKFAMSEITGSAEDYDGARLRYGPRG